MQITQQLSKYRLTTNAVKFVQQQLHQRQQVTELLAVVTIAVHHVQQFITIHCTLI